MAADSPIAAGSDRAVSTKPLTDLFPTGPTVPADPAVRRHTAERHRVQAQCAAILAAFRADPYREQTTSQLFAIACKYTSRISDLRAAGHQIIRRYRNRITGENVYHYAGQGEPRRTRPIAFDVAFVLTQMRDLDRYLDNWGIGSDHPWRRGIAAVIAAGEQA